MTIASQPRKSSFCLATAALALAIVLALTVVASPAAQAQTFQVLHTFTGGGDGGIPQAGVTLDRAGNLYGTTTGGAAGYGTAYQLKHAGGGWTVNTLYSFTGGSDGGQPLARVIFGPDGSLYGTTIVGGNQSCVITTPPPYGCGVVFRLRPKPTVCFTSLCPWQETVLYSFNGGTDGSGPLFGDLLFDQAGNIYGTTQNGGDGSGCGGYGCGTVWELTHSGTESVLHAFSDSGGDGASPWGGVIFDQAGNLFGTTPYGGDFTECQAGCGTAFELSPSGSGWTESPPYSFEFGGAGAFPFAGLTSDHSGNFYGGTATGGPDAGTVFELTHPNGSWTVNTIYSFNGGFGTSGGPWVSLALDGTGNIYGTTLDGGANGVGNVFKLTPAGNGAWTYTSLHDFTGGSDGGNPSSNVVFDATGNLYGTAGEGGLAGGCGGTGCGVVWEVTP